MKILRAFSLFTLALNLNGVALAGDIFSAMQFDGLASKVKGIYKSEFNRYLGKDLEIQINYDLKMKNAAIRLDGDQYQMIMTEPMVEELMKTPDAAALVLCHEIGHVLGGGPFKRKALKAGDPPLPWAAAEGQSDYFATSKCAKRVFKDDDNHSIVRHFKFDQEVKDKCSEVYGSDDEYYLCLRTAKAIIELTRYQAANKQGTPRLTTPATSVASKTIINYPSLQCRMDTMFQGSLCDIDPEIMASRFSPNAGNCNRKDGYTVGARPKCWYDEK